MNVEQFFLVFSDRTRLRLLNLMGDQEVCVCFFVEILGLPQPTISRHLSTLRRAGLVEARRQGKWMHYRIIPPMDDAARNVLRESLRMLESDKQMRSDRGRLIRASCAPNKFVKLQGAPLPAPVRETKANL